MNYSLELHSRGRQIVNCEAYDRVSKSTVVKQGILIGVSRGRVLVSIPTANISRHTFSMIADDNGYGYEGGMNQARGWRIKLDQVKFDQERPIPDPEAKNPLSAELISEPPKSSVTLEDRTSLAYRLAHRETAPQHVSRSPRLVAAQATDENIRQNVGGL